ncbi:hypothetical protein QBC34DRAFT_444254 [Podospora aff. communis PSN243]|uniref:Heterokaryon incompatibility domain-containing protein n=1 Tax=Podospora aff. communis PSN243 TaxID=3040156 RepID=A0AAV9G2A1_9PEZI|nr:hypothetical protein QBC34DRAFT_444254 [Podospora aff. communis PSN243]
MASELNQRPIHGHMEFVPLPLNAEVDSHVDRQVTSPGTLCRKCVGFRDWLRRLLSGKPRAIWADVKSQEYSHYSEGAALDDSRRAGCHLCTHIINAIGRKGYMISLIGVSVGSGDRIAMQSSLEQIRHARNFVLHVVGVPPSDAAPNRVLQIQVTADGAGTFPAILQLITPEPRFPGASLDISQALATRHVSTRSPASFSLLRCWLQYCLDNHSLCHQRVGTTMPTRLLHIASVSPGSNAFTYTVKLVHGPEFGPGAHNQVRYIALSYCWGTTGECYKLTKETLPALTKGAATMADVYRNCEVELAALGARGNGEGLFARRDSLMYHACHLLSIDGEDLSVITKEFRHRGEVTDEWPLYERGWVFQERVLPARTIKFGPFLAWECREMKVDEFNLVRPILDPREQWRFEDKLLSREFHGRNSEPNTEEEAETIYAFWREARNHFSGLALTKPTDRLVAIQGLITTVARYTGWKAACGLWDNFLLRELLWRTAPLNVHASSSGLSPSWSWITITGEVWNASTPSETLAEAKILSDYDEDEIPPSLLLRAVPIRVHQMEAEAPRVLDRSTGSIMQGIPDKFKLALNIFESIRVSYYPDVPRDAECPAAFLPIGLTTLEQYPDPQGMVVGIAVQPLFPGMGIFRRVGVAEATYEKGSTDEDVLRLLELVRDEDAREGVILV